MRFIFGIAVAGFTSVALSQEVSVEEACRTRAITYSAIAQDRDNGVPEEKVLKDAYQKIPQLRRTNFSAMVTALYSEKGRTLSPAQVKDWQFSSCLKEKGH